MAGKQKLTRKEKRQQQPVTKPSIPVNKEAGEKKRIRIIGLFIAAFAFLLYANTLGHGYVLDDYSVIKDNWLVQRGTEALPDLFKTSYRHGYWNSPGTLYRPLSLVMFAVEWQYFPDTPGISHLMNILLYALSGFILFITLQKLLSNYHVFLPLITTLLFMAHPIHTEVVANIKSRDEILSFLFIITALLLILKYIEKRGLKWLVLAAFSYFLAFMSKESAITMLAIFPLALFLFSKISLKRNILITGVMSAGAIIYLILRQGVLGNVGGIEDVNLLDNFLVGAPDAMSKTATAMMILGKYVILLLFPHPLVSDYSFNQLPIVGFDDYRALLSLLLYLGIGVFAVLRVKKQALPAFGILFYLITMSLYTNIFITIGSALGERFLFLPSLGFCLVLAAVMMKIFKVDEHEDKWTLPILLKQHQGLAALTALILLAYSVKTVGRNSEWESNFSLYSADVQKCPNSARLQYTMGLEYVQSRALKVNNPAEKQQYFDQAIGYFSNAIAIYSSYADAYDQRGLTWYRKGKFDKAIADYQAALKINPQKAISYSNLGVIYFSQGNYEQALNVYQNAVKYDPRYADAWLNLGSTCATLGKFDEAIQAYKNGLQYSPNNASMNYFLGITYQNTGDKANAATYLNKAYQLDPSLRK